MTFLVSASDWMIKEYEAFKAKLPELLVKYRDKYVVIKDGEVQGIFESIEEAYKYALEKYGINGMFIIQKVKEERAEYFSPTHALGLDSAQVS
ncbi:hypothetical protein [Caldivirga maquilingensis]|uniref:DUF5678 domain-containing protein n=1 Tax=Caldivirga maquilingensis (strain ATCC 700844 / DSM 13496 / JCM 10307 / IC-167) TaxID=397948 RepID=A8MA22_CALMQ|nr:hypothetical protein [Caldivirga maquilingensis]ABW00954.1 hypothetical protein Cmaq_0100 [Caldivirga maquilingensis IC-167]